jgi:hypothetical protein
MKKGAIILAVIVILLLSRKEVKGADIDYSKPRGIRNNNPGNIKISSSNWAGKVPIEDNTDGVFEQFTHISYGIRAALILLKKYYREYGLKTIRGIVNRWAPPTENETNIYVRTVSDCMGIGEGFELGLGYLPDLAYCMFLVENGGQFPGGLSAVKKVWNEI